jgi:hypothetical protein
MASASNVTSNGRFMRVPFGMTAGRNSPDMVVLLL